MFYLIVLVLLCIGFLYLTRSQHRPGMAAFRGHRFAHRGLHQEGIPENSRAAFRAARDAGFGIEFDLHLLRDGNLGVMHDSALLRTTGQDGRMEDLTAEDLPAYRLGGTEETIPLFRDVLEIFQGQYPLIIELKSVDGNAAALTQATVNQLEGYQGPYCIESFDPAVVRWLRRNRPDILRGQLSENYFRVSSPLPAIIKAALSLYLCNWGTRPDFIAHRFEHRKNIGVWLCRRLWHTDAVTWTIRSIPDLETAEKEGFIPIFEKIRPEAK